MAKSREKIQQLGFWDAEVSKPDHDSVCMWAYENADRIFKIVFPELFDQPWKKNEISLPYDYPGHVVQGVNELANNFVENTPRPNPRVCKRTLEYVLASHSGYQGKMERIVGYADLLIETELPHISPNYKFDKERREDVFDGFELAWSRGSDAPRILVEAKSAMPTVGELMRQIQLYRTAFHGKFVVVSPDDKYEGVLSEQEVAFIQYTP